MRVTLSVPGLLDRAPDPTLTLTQAERARSFRGELSGRLLLTPTDADAGVPQLRVPLFAAPRPASDLTASVGQAVSRASGEPDTLLTLTGTAAVTSAGPASLVSAFALGGEGARWPDCPAGTPGATSLSGVAPGAEAPRVAALAAAPSPPGAPSPAAPSAAPSTTPSAAAHPATATPPCADRPGERAADLRAVGAATDAPAVDGDPLAHGTLYLAATSWASAPSPVGLTAVRFSLDTDGDGIPDVVVMADRLRGSDVLVARTVDARTGRELDVQPLDARWGDTDTDLLDSDTVVLPVRLATLPGLRPGASTIRYAAWTGFAGGSPDPAGAFTRVGFAGTRPTLEIDALHPAVDIRAGAVGPGGAGPAAIASPELPGGVLEVRRAGPAPARLLLVHHLNTDGNRAQLLTVG